MATIKWRDSYSVDFEELDEQHRMLVKLINEMFIIVRNNEIELPPIHQIDELIHYTQEHLNFEEDLLEKAGYKLLAHHKEVHRTLVNRVVELKEQIKNNTEEMTSELYSFLRNWLTDHILKEDMQYRNCLSAAHERGIL